MEIYKNLNLSKKNDNFNKTNLNDFEDIEKDLFIFNEIEKLGRNLKHKKNKKIIYSDQIMK